MQPKLSLLTKWLVFLQNASGNPRSLSLFWKVRGQCYRSPASQLTAVSGTCPDVCVQQSHVAKRQYCNLKWTLEDLLPCYCYTLKTNSKTIRSQIWQPAPALPDENFGKPNSAKKRPVKSQIIWLKTRKTSKLICDIALHWSQKNIWITRNNKHFFSKLRLSLFWHCNEAHYWCFSDFSWFVTVRLHTFGTMVLQFAYWSIGTFLHLCESHLHPCT